LLVAVARVGAPPTIRVCPADVSLSPSLRFSDAHFLCPFAAGLHPPAWCVQDALLHGEGRADVGREGGEGGRKEGVLDRKHSRIGELQRAILEEGAGEGRGG